MSLFRKSITEAQNNLKLYHYNLEEFDVLKSKSSQDNIPSEGAFDYTNSISFFLEPIPLEIADIFEGRHEFWKHGLRLIEHTVLIKDIPDDIYYVLTETAEKTKLVKELIWVKGNFYKNMAVIEAMETKLGYRGQCKDNVIKAMQGYKKGLAEYYRQAYELGKEDPAFEVTSRYAAAVPHFMLYPGMVQIKVNNTKVIRLR